MFSALLACVACLAAGLPGPVAAESQGKTSAFAAYQEARARSGRDPNAHVRLALWCERHGLATERQKHLAIAVLKNPAHAAARGLMGSVASRGEWHSPEAIRDKMKADEQKSESLAEYRARRARTDNSADAHWKLALWCKAHGLDPEATVHLTIVTQLDPGREAAWKRLGYTKEARRWVTAEQLAAEKAAALAQKKADKHWTALLSRLRSSVESKARRPEALKALQGVTDPRSVPSVWTTFARGKAEEQTIAVQVLGQINSMGSTRAQAILAVAGKSAEVRRIATETLRRRDPRDIASLLVGLLRDPELDADPILYHYSLSPTGWDAVGSTGVLFVQGPRYDVLRTYPRAAFIMFSDPSGLVPVLPSPGYEIGVMRQREQQAADLAAIIGQILSESEEEVLAAKHHVGQVEELNAQLIRVLAATTGQNLGEEREAWRKWWAEEQGYTYDPPPPRPRQDLTLSDSKPTFVSEVRIDCFAAGTPIHTLTGLRPIESVEIGDQVLTQDPRTGTLRYRPVVATVHSKPETVLKADLGQESIKATGIDRFWKVGQGWVMARDLKTGDVLRALGGVATAKSVENIGSEPVFNLKVMQAESFFVGERGMLVHDNSLVEPVLEPFDGIPELGDMRERP